MVAPFSPCQVFVSLFDRRGIADPEASFNILTMTSFDPHTTQKKSRTCRDCHGDPKSLGFGEGILSKNGKSWQFRPTYDARASGMGRDAALDAFVDTRGTPLHSAARREARPFNREELEKILAVDGCLPCHGHYEDRIYGNFKRSKERFKTERDLPCRGLARRYTP
jgi:hypothetical protein